MSNGRGPNAGARAPSAGFARDDGEEGSCGASDIRAADVPHPSPLPTQGEGIRREAKEKDPGSLDFAQDDGLGRDDGGHWKCSRFSRQHRHVPLPCSPKPAIVMIESKNC